MARRGRSESRQTHQSAEGLQTRGKQRSSQTLPQRMAAPRRSPRSFSPTVPPHARGPQPPTHQKHAAPPVQKAFSPPHIRTLPPLNMPAQDANPYNPSLTLNNFSPLCAPGSHDSDRWCVLPFLSSLGVTADWCYGVPEAACPELLLLRQKDLWG